MGVEHLVLTTSSGSRHSNDAAIEVSFRSFPTPNFENILLMGLIEMLLSSLGCNANDYFSA